MWNFIDLNLYVKGRLCYWDITCLFLCIYIYYILNSFYFYYCGRDIFYLSFFYDFYDNSDYGDVCVFFYGGWLVFGFFSGIGFVYLLVKR